MLKTKKFQPFSTEFDLRDVLLTVLVESCSGLDLQATHTGSLDSFLFTDSHKFVFKVGPTVVRISKQSLEHGTLTRSPSGFVFEII